MSYVIILFYFKQYFVSLKLSLEISWNYCLIYSPVFDCFGFDSKEKKSFMFLGEFNIYTREAGAGGLSIAVEGPSKAELDFDDRKDGSCGVKYIVTEPGEYLVSVKFNDEHIPESPFKVYITPSIGDARKLSVAALQQKGLQVGVGILTEKKNREKSIDTQLIFMYCGLC